MLKELKENPFVVDLKYTFQDHKNLYFVMEYINGETLASQIKVKLGIHDDKFLFYASEMIVALSLLHSNNVIYRNLKPDNVMIDQYGHLKFLDFGLAKQFNDIRKERTYTQ